MYADKRDSHTDTGGVKAAQIMIRGTGSRKRGPGLMDTIGAGRRWLVVCSRTALGRAGAETVHGAAPSPVYFHDFSPNPSYEDICRGVSSFKENGCGAVMAIGGGSAIDTAKCIKLFCRMPASHDYAAGPLAENGIPLLAMPTTAGSGSESTRFAVFYRNGEKNSIDHYSILPTAAILDAGTLITLPPYQRKCTLLDAFCQAIESWWSVNSTEESIAHSREAVGKITANMRAYVGGADDINAAEAIMDASNSAGRAINITRTTAPHAMSYKLTTLYHIPHGHAVALSMPGVWRHMLEHPEQLKDSRGAEYFSGVLSDIAASLGCASPGECAGWFENLLEELDIRPPRCVNEEDANLLARSVNLQRLKNNPVEINAGDLHAIYRRMLSGGS